MAEQAIVTPGAEEIAPKDGSVAAALSQDEPKVPTTPKEETVPLKAFLDLKKDLKDLKKDLSEAKTNPEKTRVEIEGLNELAQKYPDVDGNFLRDLLNSASQTAAKKLEDKFSTVIEEQENDRKRAAFDKAFDTLYDKTLLDNPDLPKTIDKDSIKELAQTPKYRNTPLADILLKMYPVSSEGRGSSENETRSAADRVDDVVSFDKITKDQEQAILADPKSRAKYFAWRDANNK